MTKKREPVIEEPYRVAVIGNGRIYPDVSSEFEMFGEACDWGWEQLKQRTRWADRASFVITKGGEMVMQIIASERVGMYDRASEQYTLPRTA